MQMCVIQDVPVVVLLVFARSILELGIPNFKYSASRSREWMYLFIFLLLFVCFTTWICVRFTACISTVVCDVPEKAKLLLDCVSGQQHSVKTLILIENFDADLVSRAQKCGIDIISLREAEVNKPQIVCSNLCITPVKAIDACVCVWWGLFVLLWPRSRINCGSDTSAAVYRTSFKPYFFFFFFF